MIDQEKQLNLYVKNNRLIDAKNLSLQILEQQPSSAIAHQTLIQYNFNTRNFAQCIKQCIKLLTVSPNDFVALKFEILSYIEQKEFLLARQKVDFALKNYSNNIELLLLKAEVNICQQNYDAALDVYKQLYDFKPLFFSACTLVEAPNYRQHFNNVSNLLKRDAHQKMEPLIGISERIDQAINCFFGLEKYVPYTPLQKGSFFNIPQLSAKPFYQVDEIPNLKVLLDDLTANMASIKQILKGVKRDSYIESIDSKVTEQDWVLLSKKWQSIHLLKAGKECKVNTEMEQIQKIFATDVIADCSPHAPEAFISILPADTKIPPHYGLSNVKLTVHLPIYVDLKSSITVGGERKIWHRDGVLVFDDSFLHSAENNSENARAVLIFDIWHPDLTDAEKEAIREFMLTYDNWSKVFAPLSQAVQLALK